MLATRIQQHVKERVIHYNHTDLFKACTSCLIFNNKTINTHINRLKTLQLILYLMKTLCFCSMIENKAKISVVVTHIKQS